MPNPGRNSLPLALALGELFDLRTLQRLLLRLGDAGQDVADSVEWQAGLTHAAFEVTERLVERGLVDDPLFHAMLEERPLRAARLKEVAVQVGVAWNPNEATRAARDDLLQLSMLLRDVISSHELRGALERLGEAGQSVSRDVAWDAGHSQASFEVARLLVQQGLVGKPLFVALRENRDTDEAERIIVAAARYGVHGLRHAGLPAGRKAVWRLVRRGAAALLTVGVALFIGCRFAFPPLRAHIFVDKRAWTHQVVPSQSEVWCWAEGPTRSEVRWTSRDITKPADWQKGKARLVAKHGERWTCEARDPRLLRRDGNRTIEVNNPPPSVKPTINTSVGQANCTIEPPPNTRVDLVWRLKEATGPALVSEPLSVEVLADGRHRRSDRLPPGSWLCMATVTDALGDFATAVSEHPVPCTARFDGAAPIRPAGSPSDPALWPDDGSEVVVLRLRTQDTRSGWRREVLIAGSPDPIWGDNGPRAIGGAVTKGDVHSARAAWGRRLDATDWKELEQGIVRHCLDLALHATSGDRR
jgi:hypothetical protein